MFSANTMKCQCSHNLYEYSCNGKAIILAQLSTRGRKDHNLSSVQKTNIFLELHGRKQGANVVTF